MLTSPSSCALCGVCSCNEDDWSLRICIEEPFTNFGANAVEKLFGENEITELIELAKMLVA